MRIALLAVLLFARTAAAQVEPGEPTPPEPTPTETPSPLFPDSPPPPNVVASPTPVASPSPTPVSDPEPDPESAATPTPVPAASPVPTAPPAQAEPEPAPTPRPMRIFESPKWYSAELGGGALQLEGDVVTEVYGDDYEPAVHGRLGVLFFSILDLGVSADFVQITGRRIGADTGERSAEISRLTLVPMSANAIVRLDFFRNQPIVPYAGAGWAYLVWSDRDVIEDDQVDGDKQGVTILAGAQILLDMLEPSRAQDLDGWWGVNDTYLTLEVSKTTYGDSDDVEGLDLGHLEGRAAFLFEF